MKFSLVLNMLVPNRLSIRGCHSITVNTIYWVEDDLWLRYPQFWFKCISCLVFMHVQVNAYGPKCHLPGGMACLPHFIKITRLVAAIKSLRFALLIVQRNILIHAPYTHIVILYLSSNWCKTEIQSRLWFATFTFSGEFQFVYCVCIYLDVWYFFQRDAQIKSAWGHADSLLMVFLNPTWYNNR